MTTDQGTERILAAFPKVSVDQMVGWANSTMESLMQQGGAQMSCDGDEAAEESVAHYHLDTSKCLNFPGVLHAIHNATKDVKNSVPTFEAFVKDLTHVCRLLSEKHYLERFLATCCNSAIDENAGLYRSAFTTQALGSLKVHDKRWGSVAQAILKLGSMEGPLRATWSRARFTYGRSANSVQEVDLAILDQAITSSLFWLCRAVYSPLAETLGPCSAMG